MCVSACLSGCYNGVPGCIGVCITVCMAGSLRVLICMCGEPLVLVERVNAHLAAQVMTQVTGADIDGSARKSPPSVTPRAGPLCYVSPPPPGRRAHAVVI